MFQWTTYPSRFRLNESKSGQGRFLKNSSLRCPKTCSVAPLSRQLPFLDWIGNGVLDSFLEDEPLFGEFLRTPVSEGGMEPLVVGPLHVVVEVMPQLLDRGVVVPVRELLLQQPVRRLDHGVVVGSALA